MAAHRPAVLLVRRLVRRRPPTAGRRTTPRTRDTAESLTADEGAPVPRPFGRPATAGRRTRRRVFQLFFYFFTSIYTPSSHFIFTPFSHLLSSLLTLTLSTMNPDHFPNPNSADDGMPMFGKSSARWPGHEDYRVETPGSVESNAEFDPFFTTDAYGVDDMEPSQGHPSARQPKATRKKRMARKEKAPAVPLPTDEVNDEYAGKRTNYSDEEYKLLVECWIDISEDPIYSNNQTMAGYWSRIEQKYNELKPRWAYKRNKEQLRKCWERIKGHVNDFSAVYTKIRDDRASGESMEDVIQKSMSTYQGMYGQFKFYNIWLMLKDKPKFDGGIAPAPKRTKNTAGGGYTSSSGARSVDLNVDLEASSGTPTSTARRPIGIKTAKAQAKGKGKATSSAPQVPVDDTDIEQFDMFRQSYDMRLLLDTQAALEHTDDPSSRQMYENMIEKLKNRLGL